MPSPYICPRCERAYERSWLLSGRCDDCGARLEPREHLRLRERRGRGDHVEQVDLEGWPAFARGVRVWRSRGMDEKPPPPAELLVELPTGEVFLLERREQLARSAMAISTPQQALDYVHFLHGRMPGHHAYGQDGLAPLAVQHPSVIDPVRRFLMLHEVFEMRPGGALPPATVRERREGDQRRFEVERYVLPREALPTEPGKPCTVTTLLRLDETVWPDGRYAYQASEFPPPETGYRSAAARSLAPLAIVLTERRLPGGRPLSVGGLPVVARVRGGAGWG